MTATRIWFVTGLTVATLATSAQSAPLEAYGKLPSIEHVAISPDGARLAIVATDGEQRNVIIETVADQKTEARIKAGAQKLRDIRWAGPNHLLLTVSTTKTAFRGVTAPLSEWRLVVDYNLRTRTQLTLLGNGDAGMNVVLGAPNVRFIAGRPVAFVQGMEFVGGEGRPSLYAVDLDSGRATVAATAQTYTEAWLVDGAGEPAAHTEFNAKTRTWRLYVGQAGGSRLIKTISASIEHPSLIGFGRDGRTILVDDNEGDQDSLREVEPQASDWGAPTPIAEGQHFIFDPATDTLIGTEAFVGDEAHYSFFSAADQSGWRTTLKAFPGQIVHLASWSADHRKLVVLTDSPTLGPAYALVDLDAKTAHWIGPVYDGLKEGDVAPVRTVAFKAKDGLPLTGYLTLPVGRDPKQLPLIVFPHGGPAVRDNPGFDWWAQAMASRGYAVLQVNYRGSAGFGWQFESAGFGEWGRKMQTDLSDGVRYLAARGTIDPKRVCIVGASYGGYAALAGATLDLGVYRCAVDISGPSDLRQMVSWSKDRGGVYIERWWDRFMGADKGGRLEDISPATHADAASIPILIIHGKDDTVVPFEQSQTMANALKRAGKPFDFVVLQHEDHWLSRGDTRLQMLQAAMAFIEKNNPPQ